MTDEIEEGPDPNDVRRHAKRMHTEIEYRKRYRRLDYYRPNKKQAEFHALDVVEKMFRAGISSARPMLPQPRWRFMRRSFILMTGGKAVAF
jgi:hypothetical protein